MAFNLDISTWWLSVISRSGSKDQIVGHKFTVMAGKIYVMKTLNFVDAVTLWQVTLASRPFCLGQPEHIVNLNMNIAGLYDVSLQCFDAVGWAAGRASSL